MMKRTILLLGNLSPLIYYPLAQIQNRKPRKGASLVCRVTKPRGDATHISCISVAEQMCFLRKSFGVGSNNRCKFASKTLRRGRHRLFRCFQPAKKRAQLLHVGCTELLHGYW